MTSKEAMLSIESFLAYEDFQEELKAIAEDFEVLEILKKHVSIFNTLPQCMYPDLIILSGSEINIEEAKIIKKWLDKNDIDK